jgi:Superfamily II DNA/RNA helicases, SNF2 family
MFLIKKNSSLTFSSVVLTTFTALMNDLAHSNYNPYIVLDGSSEQRASRKRKRYRIVPSPLMSINWWRVALDEAQRVDTPTASSAQMALKLISRHRWCISGTPIGRGNIDDLYGLLLFLQVKPFCDKDSFKTCIKAEYDDMLDRVAYMLHESLWRSTKANSTVRIQMGIPEQIEKRITLKFSSVERHFYQKQLEDTILAADRILSNKTRRKAKESDMLSDQLRKLRAACCHPQVGSSGIGKIRKHHGSSDGINVASGVLTMSQILDKLIDDAKLQAEEAQRIYTLNSNALACLYKLKAESRDLNGMFVLEDENDLLGKSCKAYLDAIDTADRNSQPCAVVGESIMSGSDGFRRQGSVVRNGSVSLSWIFCRNNDCHDSSCLWARFDFSGSTKKISAIALRSMTDTPEDCIALYPRECCLQVSNPAIGGIFVESLPFTLPHPNETSTDNNLDWRQFGSLQPHKSKSWRILVKTFYPLDHSDVCLDKKLFVGFHVQLMEPEIIPDSLQRLHILHNGVLTLKALEEKGGCIRTSDKVHSKDFITSNIKNMTNEKDKLESHYVEAARVLQLASDTRLSDVSTKRKVFQRELFKYRSGPSDTSFEPWWQELLAWCHMYPIPRNQVSLADFTEDSLFQLFNDPSQTFNRRSFPFVETADGLHIALTIKMQDNSFFRNILDNAVFKCIDSIAGLPDHPSNRDIYENSHCRKCRSDWDQKGPICKCCKLEEELLKHEDNFKDPEINCILQSMSDWIKSTVDKNRRSSNRSVESNLQQLVDISKRADKFFEFRDVIRKELDYAKAKWKTHLNLLSDIDELNQCKRTMRLAFDENISSMTAHERAFVVNPCDIPVLIMDHAAKQAMAEGNLRRLKDLLRFLKNQNQEQQITAQDNQEDANNFCCICLCPFHKEKAVLRCGHAYHYDPCVQRLLVRSGGTVTCPMRCPIRTKKDDILIASDFSKDDGSKVTKKIQGQWGTKVCQRMSCMIV